MAAPGMPPLPSNPDENDGPRILAATLTTTSAALVALTARLYVRIFQIRSFGWDDAIMTFAMAISISGQALIIPQVYYGGGQHIGDIDPAHLSTALKLNFITQPIYLICICTVKLAVGAALLRIASQRFYTVTIASLMTFMGLWAVSCFSTLMLQCTDIRVLWDPTIQTTCWPQSTLQGLSYTNAAFNILTDLLFSIIIPVPMLWNLNVNRRTRATLVLILGLGVFACIASMVKVKYIVNYGKPGDWLWDSRDITIWTVAETNVGITAGCLATLRPLARRFLGSVYGKGSQEGSGPGGRRSRRHYGSSRGAGRSGKMQSGNESKAWRSLSSGLRDEPGDETSSERPLAIRDEYEMAYTKTVQGTAFKADVEAKTSDESIGRLWQGTGPATGHPGITKTMTTEVTYGNTRGARSP